jgi:PhoPQ-activated pathogenicity-related protein
VLELTSQTWRKPEEVDRPVWTHWMTVVKPTEVASDKALLFIGGGDNGDPAPTKASERSVRFARETKSVVVDLGMVPNQPLVFWDSRDQKREEDDLIAYTRVKHFTTKDDEWLVRLAMVKSGVKAMDATQEFMKSAEGGGVPINQFVVAGGSKRGWTTWLVGATDERVIGIMPLVIDALNSEAITKHHFEVLGFFAPSLGDYVNHGLFPHKIGTPDYKAVLDIEDPYNYRNRARLTIPKFIVNASGDQFFLPDNSQFYYGDLPAEKRLRYVENSRHNLAETDAQDSMLAWYQSVITGGKRPDYSWTKAPDGTLTVTTADKPKEVKLWQAHNPKTRDFRVEHLGKAYTASVLQPQADGTYVGHVDKPASGYTAFFVELTYDSGFSTPFKFSTEVSITPDVLPFKWEDAAAKYAATAPK